MKIDFLTLCLFLISILKFCKAICGFNQTCKDPFNEDCLVPDIPLNNTPFIVQGPNIVCDEFKGELGCCNNDQNVLMGNIKDD